MRPLTLIGYKTWITTRTRIKPVKTYSTAIEQSERRREEMELQQCRNLPDEAKGTAKSCAEIKQYDKLYCYHKSVHQSKQGADR